MHVKKMMSDERDKHSDTFRYITFFICDLCLLHFDSFLLSLSKTYSNAA